MTTASEIIKALESAPINVRQEVVSYIIGDVEIPCAYDRIEELMRENARNSGVVISHEQVTNLVDEVMNCG